MHVHISWQLVIWSLLVLLVICSSVAFAVFFAAVSRLHHRQIEGKTPVKEGKTDLTSVRTRATFEKLQKKGYSSVKLGVDLCFTGIAYLAIFALFFKAIFSSPRALIYAFLLTYTLPLVASILLLALFLMAMRALGKESLEKLRAAWEQRDEESWSKGDDTGPLASFLLWVFSKISAATLLPIVVMRDLLYTRFPALHRIVPNPVILWLSILTYFAYRLEISGARTLALYLAISVCASALYKSLFSLTTEQGVLSFFIQRKERISPGRILAYALILAVSFGCIHLHIWNRDNGNYAISSSHPFTWQDALYFSITTISTVGYGDIHPLTHVAQWACITEIVCGLVLLVIAVNTSITLWLDKNRLREETTLQSLVVASNPSIPRPPETSTEPPIGTAKEA